jgi:Ca-activated chloride channel family protein
MHLDPNDPRLTAYALGELDESERGEFEQHLSGCPACQQEVERIRELSAALNRELAKEPLPMAEVRPIRLPVAKRPKKVVRGLLAAACVLLMGSVGLMISYQRNQPGAQVRQAIVPSSNERGIASDEDYDAPLYANRHVEWGIANQAGAAKSPAPSATAPAEPSLAPSDLTTETLTLSDGVPATRGADNGPVYPVADLVIPIRNQPTGASAAPTTATGTYTGGTTINSGGQPPTTAAAPSYVVTKPAYQGTGGDGQSPTLATVPGSRPSLAAPKSKMLNRTSLAPGDVVDGRELRDSQRRIRADGLFLDPDAAKDSEIDVKFREPGLADGSQDEQAAKLATVVPTPPALVPGPLPDREFNTEAYDRVVDNPFLDALKNPLSTFSIDVDTASYSIVRRFLMEGNSLPPKDAVRIEELVNYFTYDYAPPKDDAPFAAHIEAADCPWQPEHRLVRIGLKGRVIADDDRPASNLVFLLDVSGSMQPANKLPLVQQAMSMLVRKLGNRDRVAIAVYAGASGLVLPSTSCERQETILGALDRLQAGGSTNGGEGIQLAYQVAKQNFVRGGTNRVILCTDGDFNVGITNRGDLTRLIEKEAAGGVFLTVLGFGMGNLKDATLEQLADKGNGNYGYVDSPAEARKLLVEQLGGTLVTIAKDVKIQVEFNPAHAASYRLIGYENRILRKEDFNNDRIDAGEIGAGHTVTALYEVVPPGVASGTTAVDPLKYQPPKPAMPAANASRELLTLKLRYKQPEGQTSTLVEHPFTDKGAHWAASSRDFRFAAAVAAFGMVLRDSPYKGHATLDSVLEWATEGKGADRQGYRSEFFTLLDRAKSLMAK